VSLFGKILFGDFDGKIFILTIKICRKNTKKCLDQMMLCVVTFHKFLPFVEPNFISDGPTNRLSILGL